MIERIVWLMIARTREFYRDLSSLGWNFLFPIFVIVGFGFIFNGRANGVLKVGVVGGTEAVKTAEILIDPKHNQIVPFASLDAGLDRVRHHRVDLLLDPSTRPPKYWVSESSPKGYLAEKLLVAAASPPKAGASATLEKATVQGREIPYAEWAFPGVLGMNLMFSALWGVGYVLVRYRKNGMLRRIRATPVRAWEFLTAQVLSRIVILMCATALVYLGCWALYHFECRGSLLLLTFVFFMGSLSMISLGMLVASRGQSEEFANGLLNMFSWPMMFLSEVWFSLEGSSPAVKAASNALPLTHLVRSARAIMNDGAGWSQVAPSLGYMAVVTVVCMVVGSAIFQWSDK